MKSSKIRTIPWIEKLKDQTFNQTIKQIRRRVMLMKMMKGVQMTPRKETEAKVPHLLPQTTLIHRMKPNSQ